MNYQVMYWRPKSISKTWLWVAMTVSLAGMASVQCWPKQVAPVETARLLAAASKAETAIHQIGELRAQQGHTILPQLDPQGSHLIGPTMSMVTSKLGSLESKQTSINPNFAAVVAQWLADAGVQPGDRIAIGASGSWPALNVAVYAAAEAMQLNPTIVLSAASSQYGANSTNLMWVDMESHLHDSNVFPFRAEAASLGGLHDRAAGMTEDMKRLLAAAIERNGVPLLESATLSDSVDQRMALYDAPLDNDGYAAYINIGGGSASIGGSKGQQCLPAGVHRELANSVPMPDCVAARMLRRGVPVIHVGDAKSIATQYGFPVAPAILPPVGEGAIYGKPVYRRSLAAAMICLTCVLMTITVAPGWVFRLRQRCGVRSSTQGRDPLGLQLPAQVEWMV